MLVIPNLHEYTKLLGDGLDDAARRPAAERVLGALVAVLGSLRSSQPFLTNGHTVTDDLRSRLVDKVGDIIASRIVEAGEVQLAHIILES